MKLLVKCPGCGNQQQTEVRRTLPGSKRKKCVYCNKSFDIRTHIIKEIK